MEKINIKKLGGWIYQGGIDLVNFPGEIHQGKYSALHKTLVMIKSSI